MHDPLAIALDEFEEASKRLRKARKRLVRALADEHVSGETLIVLKQDIKDAIVARSRAFSFATST